MDPQFPDLKGRTASWEVIGWSEVITAPSSHVYHSLSIKVHFKLLVLMIS
jgi:hypothetical protein